MLHHDAKLAHAFGAGGANIIVVQHVQHARAGEAQDEGGGYDAERDGRKHEMVQTGRKARAGAAIARHWK
jgi:hypothetical protein